MNRKEQIVFFSPSGPEEEKKISIIDLVQGAEGIVITGFNTKNEKGELPTEIIVPFDEIKNLAAKEELNKEEIKAIVKFLSDKEYKIETDEEGEEFKIKMPEKLKGY